MSEESYAAEVVTALKEFGDIPVNVQMDVSEIFALVATIQLACRHPHFRGRTRQWAEEFARTLHEHYLGQLSPPLAEACDLGWRPEFDVPVDVSVQSNPNRKCRVCGCTEAHACPGGCHWVEENLCSACEPAVRSLIVP